MTAAARGLLALALSVDARDLSENYGEFGTRVAVSP